MSSAPAHLSNPDAPGQAEIPRRIGRYELVRPLGQGGMASIYLVRWRDGMGYERRAALKLLHSRLVSDTESVQRFRDEARWASWLKHPNIVSAIDAGMLGPLPYVVLEYVPGCTLEDLLEANPESRPVAWVVPLVLDILRGLHAAHTLRGEHGEHLRLVHRDVSPNNVLVGLDGTARVSDFGISKAVDSTAETARGVFMGKLEFAAPEQLALDAKPDPRVDIFATGVVLWTALTGRAALPPDSLPATMQRILHCDLPAPSRCGLRPPAWLDDLVLRAVARDPSQRFSSARHMADTLEAAATRHGALADRDDVARWVCSSIPSTRPYPEPPEDAPHEITTSGIVESPRAMHRPAAPPRHEAAPPLKIVPEGNQKTVRVSKLNMWGLAAVLLAASFLVGTLLGLTTDPEPASPTPEPGVQALP